MRPVDAGENGTAEITEATQMRFMLVLLLCLSMGGSGVLAHAQDDAAASNQETVTVPRAEWEELRARLEAVERQLQELRAGQMTAQPSEAPAPEAPAVEAAPSASAPEAQPPAGGKFLSLPDISLIVQAKGLASSDTRDDARNRIRLSEAEIGIQGYVYTNVKADAFNF